MTARKYHKGTRITSIIELIDRLDEDKLVYCRHKVYHHGFLVGWSLRTILLHLELGHFYTARKRNGNG